LVANFDGPMNILSSS